MKKNVIIIAEAGVNHNGDINIGKKLIDAASIAGADFIKFQTFKTSNLVTKKAKKSNYQIVNSKKKESQFDMLKKLEMSNSMHLNLIRYCKRKNIKFLSTAFDIDSLYYLKKIGVKIAKIPSGEITNLPYLKIIAKLFKHVIMSTGMSTIQEIKNAFNILIKLGVKRKNITILHCNSDYPTKMKDVNLKAMIHIKDEIGVDIGYSDHTLGIEIPIAAVSLGAKVIEKHFTLDKNLAGPDHKASLNPEELKNMVHSIRNIEKAIKGSGKKIPSLSELKNITSIRKSIFARCKINKGDIFDERNLVTKRPGNGISPMKWDEIIGKTSPKNFNKDDKIKF